MKYSNSISKTLAKNIINKRYTLSLTQEKLAEKANISAITIWKIENMEQWPNPDTLQSIADALNTTASQLFFNDKTDKNISKEIIAARDKHILSLLQSELSNYIPPENLPNEKEIKYEISHNKE